MNKHTIDIAQFAAQTWLIDPELRDFMLAQLMKDGHIVFTLDETPIHYTDFSWAYYAPASKKGSTAVLTIKGVIYDFYAEYLCDKINQIYADGNVRALFVKMNSPGGSANAGNKIADCLLNAPISTWCHIDYGQAGSAGYMIACSTDGISASRTNDRVGSIGTYVSYQDFSKYYEKLGIVSKDIYAEQSTEKNLEGREAAKGNFKPLENYVSQEAQAFIDYVKARRPDLNTKQMDPFKGKVFSATDAKSIGLIDEICDMKAAVKLLNSATTTTNSTPRTTMIFGYVKAEKLMALKAIEASALTTEMVKAANEELAGLGINAVALISQAEFNNLVEANNADKSDALTKAQAEVTRLTGELTTAKSNAETLEKERNNWKAKAVEFGAKDAADKTTVTKPTETQADAGDADDFDKVTAGMEHYQNVPEWLKNLESSTEKK